LNIEYISAEVEEANIGMQKVFIKCGFEQDGKFINSRVKEGQRINVLHFGINK
jgi:RimJ/RimL family protein N-acetyltransferase